ncbi:hypothetical protein K431DRAFT_346608 [Polychaeton citri CBS 116435]|uniref:Mid2 domain-containing protein n=1 Tax=Polychaeton citri CBS 116435 TaxID=1314669 RepID=A0A9P4QA22_9PEZI|nr:hypothetical protein K431DRAFT_346608 [Polychaeton citri CBS 116435]
MSYTTTIALTTVFTPPADCISKWTYEPEIWNSEPGGLLLQNEAYVSQDKTCFPSSFNNWGRAPSFIQLFSPGACPSGYSTVSNGISGATTTAVCCPNKFSYTATLSTVNAGSKSAEYYGCTSLYLGPTPTVVFAATNGTTSDLFGTSTGLETITSDILMWAQPITVAFQQKDLALFTTSASSTTATTAMITSTPNAQTSSSTPVTSQPPSSSPSSKGGSDLTGGDIAGIAIGAAAVLGIIIGLAIFFRRRNSVQLPTPQETQAAQAAPSENKYSWPQTGYPRDAYGDGHPVAAQQEQSFGTAKPEQQPLAELGNTHPRYELPNE